MKVHAVPITYMQNARAANLNLLRKMPWSRQDEFNAQEKAKKEGISVQQARAALMNGIMQAGY